MKQQKKRRREHKKNDIIIDILVLLCHLNELKRGEGGGEEKSLREKEHKGRAIYLIGGDGPQNYEPKIDYDVLWGSVERVMLHI